VTLDWADLEPTIDVFNWAALSDPINLGISNKLLIGFLIYVGPSAPGWLWSNCTVGPCVTTVTTKGAGVGQPTKYPYYMDPYYQVNFFISKNNTKSRFFNMLRNVSNYLTTKTEWKDEVIWWQR
jgi:hypothetical protein